MKYMRRIAGYTWTDYKTNTQIAKELKITPILEKLLEYNRNWRQHVNGIPRNKLQYSPTGWSHGRPLKRLLDTWDRNGSTSGQLLDRYMMIKMMMMMMKTWNEDSAVWNMCWGCSKTRTAGWSPVLHASAEMPRVLSVSRPKSNTEILRIKCRSCSLGLAKCTIFLTAPNIDSRLSHRP